VLSWGGGILSSCGGIYLGVGEQEVETFSGTVSRGKNRGSDFPSVHDVGKWWGRKLVVDVTALALPIKTIASFSEN